MSNKGQTTKKTFFGARFTAVMSISLVLFVLGIICFMGLFAKQLSAFVKENIGFTLVLDDNIKENEVKQLTYYIKSSKFAKEIEYISKDQAITELTQELGENPVEFLGYNPLQASIEVKLNADYAHQDSIQWIESAIKRKSDDIQSFEYRKDLVVMVHENINKATIILLGFAAILLLISFTLINNTVRLSIYSKRFIIHTMRLVGATPGFIRRPFIWENITNGIIASILAMGMILGLLYGVSKEYVGFDVFLEVKLLASVFGAILCIGILITLIASYFATNRYINMRSDKMYLV